MALSLQRIFVLAGPAAANADGGAAAQVAAHSVAAAGAGAGAVAGASTVQPSHFRDVPAPACMHWADQYLYVHSSTRGLLEFDAPTGVRTKRLPLIGAGSSSGADGGRPVCLASSTNTSGRSMVGGLSSTGYSTSSSCATPVVDCSCVGIESVLTTFPFHCLVVWLVLVAPCISLLTVWRTDGVGAAVHQLATVRVPVKKGLSPRVLLATSNAHLRCFAFVAYSGAPKVCMCAGVRPHPHTRTCPDNEPHY